MNYSLRFKSSKPDVQEVWKCVERTPDAERWIRILDVPNGVGENLCMSLLCATGEQAEDILRRLIYLVDGP